MRKGEWQRGKSNNDRMGMRFICVLLAIAMTLPLWPALPPAAEAAPGASPVNVLSAGTESYSAAGSVPGSIIDNDTSTHRNTYDGTHQAEAWYAVTLATPVLIDTVVYAHGHAYVDGGWFDSLGGGKPRIQLLTEEDGEWIDAGELTDYPETSPSSNGALTDGQRFALTIEPAEVYGVRIIGKPVFFASAAELQALDSTSVPDPNMLRGGTPTNAIGMTDGIGAYVDGDSDSYLLLSDGTVRTEDWYAVSLETPAAINSVVFVQGPVTAGGGWFDTSAGKPKVQVKLAPSGDWRDVGLLSLYPATTADDYADLARGKKFEAVFDPVEAYGVRVIGVPSRPLDAAGSVSGIAELQAFNDPLASAANVLLRGTPDYSRAGNAVGSFNDGNFGTARNTWNGQIEGEDWYAVELDVPQLINTIVVGHGVTSPDGGWFNTAAGKPRIEIRTEEDGEWMELAMLDDYPVTSDSDNGGLTNGQSFTVTIEPAVVLGVRVAGKPAHYPGTTFSFSSLSELQAYYELPERSYVPFNLLAASADSWTGGSLNGEEGALTVSSGEAAIYTSASYGSAAFHFKLAAALDINGGNSPFISIRGDGSGESDAYLLVPGDEVWELSKRSGGEVRVLGSIAVEDIPNYASNGVNEVWLASYEEQDGVRLILSVNGVSLLSLLDAISPITQEGFFVAFAGDGTIVLDGIEAGQPLGPLLEDGDNWTGAGVLTAEEGGYATISGGNKMYRGQKFDDEWLDFTMRYTFTGPDWPGFILRGTKSSATIFDGGSAYLIDFNADRWEVQKWVDGSRYMLIGEFPGQTPPYGTLENKAFESNTEHTLRAAAINEAEGVRLILYVDGQKIFDIVDEDEPLTDPGYFGFYAYSGPISVGSVRWEQSGPLNAYSDITGVELSGAIKPTVVDSVGKTVDAVVADEAELDNLSAEMFVSRGASVLPDPAEIKDYSSPVIYTITAEDGSQSAWTVRIAKELGEMGSFEDIAEHPDRRDILQLYAAGILNGLDETHFGPDEPLDRLDLLAAAAKAAGLEPGPYAGDYEDIEEGMPDAEWIQAAHDAGLIFPLQGDKLMPEQPATKEEMAFVLARAAREVVGQPYLLGDSDRFADAASISPWALEEIEAALGTGLLPVENSTYFQPASNILRSDFAVILRRLLYERKLFAPLYNAYASEQLDVFSLEGIPAQAEENWTVSQTNGSVPMNGLKWNEAVDERDVYHASIRHEQDGDKSWELRIGKGGQIYSLETAIGELMPPQTANNVFMDEVIQPVSISYDQHNPEQEPTMYFIHGSGIYYKNDPILTKPYYIPMMASSWNPEESAYSVAAWGLNAQIPSIWRSGVLYYTKVRDAGDGVIEVTYMLNNFGTDTIDDISIPWGGVRKSELPDHILSDATGAFDKAGGLYPQVLETYNTGGWAAMTQDADNPDSFTMATVFGKDANYGELEGQWGPNHYTWGDANRDDFYVQAVQGRFHLEPGEKLAWKFYYVLGSLKEVAEKANALANEMDYGFVTYPIEDARKLNYFIHTDSSGRKVLSLKEKGSEREAFSVYAQPAPGTTPLFVLRETATKELVLTTDPYLLGAKVPYVNPYQEGHEKHDLYEGRFQYKPYDGATDYLGMLGYVYPQGEEPDEGEGRITLEEALLGSDVYGLLTEADAGAGVLGLVNSEAAGDDDYGTGSPIEAGASGGEIALADLDARTLKDRLDDLPAEGGVIAMDIEEEGENGTEIEVPAGFGWQAAQSGKSVILSLQTTLARYELPLNAIDWDRVAAELGLSKEDIRLRIRIARPSEEMNRRLKAAAEEAGVTVVAAPVEFEIFVGNEEFHRSLNDFGGRYLTRSWLLGGDPEPDRLAAMWLTPDGALQFAPSVFDRTEHGVVATVMRPGNSVYAVIEYEKSFEDIQDHWSAEAIRKLASKRIVQGLSPESYAPDNFLTRAEWAVLLVRGLGLAGNNMRETQFPDVAVGDWHAASIAAAVEAGLIEGYEDGSLRPDIEVSRQEMAVMIDRAVHYAGGLGDHTAVEGTVSPVRFADDIYMAQWASEAVYRLRGLGLVTGRLNGEFAPEASATRAEAATILQRMLEELGFINK